MVGWVLGGLEGPRYLAVGGTRGPAASCTFVVGAPIGSGPKSGGRM
jgi:hypothetical protein